MRLLNNASAYRQHEAFWRAQAEGVGIGENRDACLVLADGYADLFMLVERLEAPCEAERRVD